MNYIAGHILILLKSTSGYLYNDSFKDLVISHVSKILNNAIVEKSNKGPIQNVSLHT